MLKIDKSRLNTSSIFSIYFTQVLHGFVHLIQIAFCKPMMMKKLD